MNKKERIEDAIEKLLLATGRGDAEKHLSKEEQLMSAAAFAAGYITSDSDVCLVLDNDTDWLQDRFEIGRVMGKEA